MKRHTLTIDDLHALEFDHLLVATSGKKIVAHVTTADGQVDFHVYHKGGQTIHRPSWLWKSSASLRIRRRRAGNLAYTTDDPRAVACIPLVLIPWSDASKNKSQNLRK